MESLASRKHFFQSLRFCFTIHFKLFSPCNVGKKKIVFALNMYLESPKRFKSTFFQKKKIKMLLYILKRGFEGK